MNKFFKLFLIFAIIAVTLFSTIVFAMFYHYGKDLPDYQQLKDYHPMMSTRIYASDGTIITEFSKEKRIFVAIDKIPDNLKNAFLAAEDADFYRHSGINVMAIFRAATNNILSSFRGKDRVFGASTITQQVVKNFLLTNERTFQRKIKEAILAYKISQAIDKDKILELYLNQIYLGSGAYGVAAASQNYFNKSIDELTIEENALLATLPKAPSKLDPRKNIEKAKERRDWVIGRMLKEGFITEQEALIATEKPINLQIKPEEELTKADFFADSVKKELNELYGSDKVFEDGIAVNTTLNPKLQEIAEKFFNIGIETYDQKHGYRGPIAKIDSMQNWNENLAKVIIEKPYKKTWKKAVVVAVAKDSATIGLENGELGNIDFPSLKWARKQIGEHRIGNAVKKVNDVLNIGDVIFVEKNENKYYLKQLPEVNGAFIAIDPHSGKVLAMMGGYVDSPNQFNRATQAMRQPGSTMKTFAYIAALENGMNPTTIVVDEPIAIDQGYGMPPYSPANYSHEFYGPNTIRTALEQSRNVSTVKMVSQIGIDKLVDVVKRFGVSENPQAVYSLALGSVETSLIKMVTAYAIMANGGNKIKPAMIEKIQDRDGKTIYKRDQRICNSCLLTNEDSKLNSNAKPPELASNNEQVTDSATAYQITSMLQGVTERGTAASAKAIGKIVAGKTGTTNNSYDSWFVGFSPDLVAGVYIGFDNPKSLGKEETGASIALPIFVNFMKEALKDQPNKPFRVPNSVKMVKINRKTGKYSTPDTPKEAIFLEALKLEEEILENNEEEESENVDSEEFQENNNDSTNNKDDPSAETENNSIDDNNGGVW
jgi:penicillin-binding protein 1A